MQEELKPCPFCGGSVSIAKMGKRIFRWFSITRGYGDTKCTCRLFMESERFLEGTDGEREKTELIKQWNHRAGEDAEDEVE